MKQLAIVVVVASLTALAGYWLGSRGKVSHGDTPAAADATGGKKLLYYRNPMGLPDTSPVPKKDPMGMDYLPVYAGEDATPDRGVKVSAEKVQKSGVKSVVVARRVIDRAVRAAGRIDVDERRVFTVAPKFEGWIERLHVNVTGQPVARGQPLFEAYSPELVSAQREYAIAAKAAAEATPESSDSRNAMQQLAEASLARLANWNVDAESAKNGVSRTLTFRSPAAGVVTEKKAVQGMRFMPGEVLYQIADLSSVWMLAEVPEQDIAQVKSGGKATLRVDAYPEKSFEGRVAYIYPTLNAQTRTVPVRIELANPGGLLKPAMYAQVEFEAGGARSVLAVPASAVIDSGTRKVVVAELGEGRFEPREVKTGARGNTFIEVVEGVREGERVVAAGNFLIDSESNLKAALGGLGGMEQPKAVGHQAVGKLDAVSAEGVTITHEPVASLKWPKMTMEFTPANAALFADIKPGTAIDFEFVERKPGEWVVTKVGRRK